MTTATRANEILCPGTHNIDSEYQDVSNAAFATALVDAMPRTAIYRRADVLGEMIDGKFVPCDVDRLRLVLDTHTRIVKRELNKDDKPVTIYKPSSRDHAALFAARARTSPSISSLEHITPYPVFVANPNAPGDWRVCRPGYSDGVYFHLPNELFGMEPILDLDEIRRLLLDLVVDFPFATEADRDTYFGLLLTPLLQPVINDNIPLHLATAPIAGSGKSKLMGEILGGIYLGRQTPTLEFHGEAHEHGKIILGELMKGRRLAHLDNLNEFLDSPVLAMLLTSRTFSARLLGTNLNPECPNHMVIVATGNNTRMTGELGRRTIPIRLEPNEQHPEHRSSFAHPDLAEYVANQREQIMSALIGAVILWMRAGRPACPGTLGSFANWHRIVGGVMHHLGFTQWLAHAQSWRDDSDEFGADLETFVRAWAEQTMPAETAAELWTLADGLGVFPWCHKKPSDAGKRMSFSTSVLRRAENRVVAGLKICSREHGSHKRYFLTQATQSQTDLGNLGNLGTT